MPSFLQLEAKSRGHEDEAPTPEAGWAEPPVHALSRAGVQTIRRMTLTVGACIAWNLLARQLCCRCHCVVAGFDAAVDCARREMHAFRGGPCDVEGEKS